MPATIVVMCVPSVLARLEAWTFGNVTKASTRAPAMKPITSNSSISVKPLCFCFRGRIIFIEFYSSALLAPGRVASVEKRAPGSVGGLHHVFGAKNQRTQSVASHEKDLK